MLGLCCCNRTSWVCQPLRARMEAGAVLPLCLSVENRGVLETAAWAEAVHWVPSGGKVGMAWGRKLAACYPCGSSRSILAASMRMACCPYGHGLLNVWAWRACPRGPPMGPCRCACPCCGQLTASSVQMNAPSPTFCGL